MTSAARGTHIQRGTRPAPSRGTVCAVPRRPRRESFPTFVEPMLLSSGPLPAAGEDWCYELKWDGMRLIACVNGSVRLWSRNRHDWTAEFPELRELASAAGLRERQVVLDGELVCLGEDGKPDFERLRARLVGRRPNARGALVRLMVFDVVHADGWAVREQPYRERRELLAELALDGPAWCTPRTFGDGEALTRVVDEHRLEGVVAKRLDRAYQPGRRSRAWVKHKVRRRATCVITGVAPARDDRAEEFLLARVHEDGRLRPAGRASYGLSGPDRAHLLAVLEELRVHGRAGRGGVWWVEPHVSVEVDFHGSGNALRDPILRAWRLSEGTTLAVADHADLDASANSRPVDSAAVS